MTHDDSASAASSDVVHNEFLPGPRRAQIDFKPSPVDWTVLSEEEAADQLDQLIDWVDWLTWRYTLDSRTVPECWPEHGSVLEELSALRTAWIQAYATTSLGSAPLDWHQAFSQARQRLADWAARTGCRPAAHRPTRETGRPTQE